VRTISRLVGCGFASAALLLGQDAAALPPPMTEQELMDASDLVIDGVGVLVECEGPSIVEDNMISTYYVTQVFPSQTYKGVHMRSIHVRGQQVEWIVPVAGPWFPDPIPVGWSGRLHLVQNNDGTYSEVWWNGAEEDETSAPEALPDCGAAGAGGAGGTGGLAGSSAAGGTAGTGGVTDTGGSAGSLAGGSAGSLAGGSAGSLAGGSAGSLAGGSAGSLAGGCAGDVTGGGAGDVTGGGADSSTGGSRTGGEAGTDNEGTGGGTGSGGDSGDDAGCGCSAAGKSTPNSGLALMLGATLCAAGLRRTRRSPPGTK
jgi:hypothetical protein